MIHRVKNASLAELATFGLPARCGELVTYDDPYADLPQLHREGLLDDAIVIGGGSNMVFAGDIPGRVIKAEGPQTVTNEEGLFTAMAHVKWDTLVKSAVSGGWRGLENLAGIPGTVGGAAVQNVGAYGAEFKDRAVAVEVYDLDKGEFVTFPAAGCEYAYRASLFKRANAERLRYIVVSAAFQLDRDSEPRLGYGALKATAEEITAGGEITPAVVSKAVVKLRDSKLPNPAVTGSAGSFFMNPELTDEQYEALKQRVAELFGPDVEPPHFLLPDGRIKVPAAWLIDKAGWKARSIGGAAVWPLQPLVLVNADGRATGADVVKLKDAIISDIQSRLGVTLRPEAVILP